MSHTSERWDCKPDTPGCYNNLVWKDLLPLETSQLPAGSSGTPVIFHFILNLTSNKCNCSTLKISIGSNLTDLFVGGSSSGHQVQVEAGEAQDRD